MYWWLAPSVKRNDVTYHFAGWRQISWALLLKIAKIYFNLWQNWITSTWTFVEWTWRYHGKKDIGKWGISRSSYKHLGTTNCFGRTWSFWIIPISLSSVWILIVSLAVLDNPGLALIVDFSVGFLVKKSCFFVPFSNTLISFSEPWKSFLSWQSPQHRLLHYFQNFRDTRTPLGVSRKARRSQDTNWDQKSDENLEGAFVKKPTKSYHNRVELVPRLGTIQGRNS